MLGAGLPALDLPALIQFVITVLAVAAASVVLVRRAAARYFVVDDASFEAAGEGRMSIGGGGGGDGEEGDRNVPDSCAACGGSATKRCSRCKVVQYCSNECQTKHWARSHKLKCKQVNSSINGACRRRKTSFGSIALVPASGTCKVMQEPKKILFPYDEFVKLFNWDKPGFLPCGLLNCGNSCFVNVVLQCLASTRPLIAYLLEKDHSRGCIRKRDDWCFLCELQAHVQRASESSQPFSPRNILSQLPNIGGNLGCGRQEDAHEFMRFAIDTMQSVCLDEYGGEKALDPSTQETTLIQHIFGGYLQSQVICTKCNMISNRYDNMMDLTVEIHGDAESLEECLDQFTMKEWLDGENMYKCDGCNDYVKAWKRLTVHQAPNILTIALKRFQSGRFGKLNKRVTFPESLDLTPYMSGNGDHSNLYTLYAVVVHLDMLNASFFGHYICYTKDYLGHWYRIDDCKVTNVDVEEVLSQGAYMLLYSRRNARRDPFIKVVEPARKKKHLVEVDLEPSSIPKAANATSALSCLGSVGDPQSNLAVQKVPIDVSLLRDTGHERQLKTRISSPGNKATDDMDLEIPDRANPDSIPNSEDVAVDDPLICSSAVKDMDEGRSRMSCSVVEDVFSVKSMQSTVTSPVKLFSVDVKPMECEESCDTTDSSSDIKDSRSVMIMEEVPKLSGSTLDSSFSAMSSAQCMAGTSYDHITMGADQDDSDNLGPKFAQSDVAADSVHSAIDVKSSSDVSSGGKEVKPLTRVHNGRGGKPKPLFSPGFLDRPARKKYVDHERKIQKQEVDHERKIQKQELGVIEALMTNGYSNGHSKASLVKQSPCADAVNLDSVSGNGFLSNYKLSEDYVNGKTTCNGSSVAASACLNGDKSEPSSPSGETATMRVNGSVYAAENYCTSPKKDAKSGLGSENGGTKYAKTESGICHESFGQVNGLLVDLMGNGTNGDYIH